MLRSYFLCTRCWCRGNRCHNIAARPSERGGATWQRQALQVEYNRLLCSWWLLTTEPCVDCLSQCGEALIAGLTKECIVDDWFSSRWGVVHTFMHYRAISYLSSTMPWITNAPIAKGACTCHSTQGSFRRITICIPKRHQIYTSYTILQQSHQFYTQAIYTDAFSPPTTCLTSSHSPYPPSSFSL